MQVEVVPLPSDLRVQHLHDRVVVVLDVLRATTTMIAALSACAREIKIFDSLDAARAAARLSRATSRGGVADQELLCGEVRCRKPDDFALGNSPADFTRDVVAGRTLFMSTTNGTRAIVAASSAPLILVGALVNANAVARALAGQQRDVTFLCAGTDGQASLEDALGAGAIIDRLSQLADIPFLPKCVADFRAAKPILAHVLRTTPGGRNIISADLESDIDFAARLDVFDVIGEATQTPDDDISIFPRSNPV